MRRLLATCIGLGVPAALGALTACGNGAAKAPERPPPVVAATPAITHRFVDRIKAIGTARAWEQVTLAAPVTERILKLNFQDGGFVGAGQVVAILAQARENAALSGALAAQRQAGLQLDRMRALAVNGYVTRSLLDEQVSADARARAAADEARAQIGDRIVRAPFGGYASLRTISAGAVINAGAPIAVISDISRIRLDFTVPETRLTSVRVGQPIEAVAAAYPDRPFRGTIATIDPVIDPSTRAVMIRATLQNPQRLLKPGMLLAVTIEAGARTSEAVPELAVIGEGGDRYVFVVGPGDKAARVPIKTGTRDAGLIEVFGVPPAARVIGDGVVKVTNGMHVRIAGARGGKKRRSAT